MAETDELTPDEMVVVAELLGRVYPGYELIGVTRPPSQPRPPEPADRALTGDVPLAPTLAALQAHYRKLGFGRSTQPAPGDDLVRVRIKLPGQAEREVRISLTDRVIVHP